MRSSLLRSSLLAATGLVLAACAAGCSASTDDDEVGEANSADTEVTEGGYVYFHGMSHLGFSTSALKGALGDDAAYVAPQLSDAQIESTPPASVTKFLGGHSGVTVSGYSLGRIPVFKLMKSAPAGKQAMTRVVMIDPTYDSAAGIGRGIGGGIAKKWLDADEGRTFMLVYGDTTKALDGDDSYRAALKDHPRAELCYVKGDHGRFREADMAQALVATDCADLIERLAAN